MNTAKAFEDWYGQGMVDEGEGRYEQAADAFLHALDACPEDAETWFNLGNALRELGRLADAERAFRAATEYDPRSAWSWFNLAEVQQALDRADDAIASLERAVAAQPSYAAAHFTLGLLCERAGRWAQARRHWLTFLQLDPWSDWARLARERLQPVQGSGPAAGSPSTTRRATS